MRFTQHALLQFPVARLDFPAPPVARHDIGRRIALTIQQRSEQEMFARLAIDDSDGAPATMLASPAVSSALVSPAVVRSASSSALCC